MHVARMATLHPTVTNPQLRLFGRPRRTLRLQPGMPGRGVVTVVVAVGAVEMVVVVGTRTVGMAMVVGTRAEVTAMVVDTRAVGVVRDVVGSRGSKPNTGGTGVGRVMQYFCC